MLNWAQYLVKLSHLEEVKVVTRFPQSILDVEFQHTLGTSGELNLTLVGRDSLGTSVGVVVSEVLMVIHEGEADGCQSTLEHGHRDAGSTQVVAATVESEATGSVVGSIDTTLNQSNLIGLKKIKSTLLKPFSGNQAERTKPLSAMLGSVSMLKAGPSLSSAWRDGDEKSEPTGLIGDADELLARARRRAGVGPLLED
ncbi:hypothetical protein KCU69_g56, partial [Aureobasidium melanogenum]